MPRYQYKCECGRREEAFLPMSECNKVISCECGRKMKKVITAPAIGGMDNLGRSRNTEK